MCFSRYQYHPGREGLEVQVKAKYVEHTVVKSVVKCVRKRGGILRKLEERVNGSFHAVLVSISAAILCMVLIFGFSLMARCRTGLPSNGCTFPGLDWSVLVCPYKLRHYL